MKHWYVILNDIQKILVYMTKLTAMFETTKNERKMSEVTEEYKKKLQHRIYKACKKDKSHVENLI